MNQESAIEMLRSLVTISLLVNTPIIAIGAVIIIGAPWMVRQLMDFTVFFINKIPEMTR